MLDGLSACAPGDGVLVGMAEGDDAGVTAVSARRVLIHTVDLMTPIVDDPRTFGQVAAANSVSDVYAMGGLPTSAVSILGVPKELPKRALVTMLEAAQEKLHEAGAALVGGHTLKDKEPKLGFAVG